MRRFAPIAAAAALACTTPKTGGRRASATATPTPTSTPTATPTAPPIEVTAPKLLALLRDCHPVSKGGYKAKRGPRFPPTIRICGLEGAVYWQADMDVDCDGKTTDECNHRTDPSYQPRTSATDENDRPLDAARLPYVVVPLPSERFDYRAAGLSLGAVVAVIYQGKLAYAVFADEGPPAIIGEGSYALAKSLGIDPDPARGGVDGGVSYIAFTGPRAVVKPIDDPAAAAKLGQALAAALIAANGS